VTRKLMWTSSVAGEGEPVWSERRPEFMIYHECKSAAT
jgi:hypothetical protein